MTDWLRMLLIAAMNVPVASTEPDLKLPAALARADRGALCRDAAPWIVLALGSSHPEKDWPDENWAACSTPCAAARPAPCS